MTKLIETHLARAFNLTFDLVESLPEHTLNLHLAELPSNSIGEQLWCMIGTRESCLKAIQAGSWQGFACSLKATSSKSMVITQLNNSAALVLEYLREQDATRSLNPLFLELLEHEVMHHGQLIRYVYAHKLGFPRSWNDRYTV